MNQNDALLSDGEQLNRSIDLLVDGKVIDAVRREWLMRLDNTPDGWRRCALAFLENQTFAECLPSRFDPVRWQETASTRAPVTIAAASSPRATWFRQAPAW